MNTGVGTLRGGSKNERAGGKIVYRPPHCSDGTAKTFLIRTRRLGHRRPRRVIPSSAVCLTRSNYTGAAAAAVSAN